MKAISLALAAAFVGFSHGLRSSCTIPGGLDLPSGQDVDGGMTAAGYGWNCAGLQTSGKVNFVKMGVSKSSFGNNKVGSAGMELQVVFWNVLANTSATAFKNVATVGSGLIFGVASPQANLTAARTNPSSLSLTPTSAGFTSAWGQTDASSGRQTLIAMSTKVATPCVGTYYAMVNGLTLNIDVAAGVLWRLVPTDPDATRFSISTNGRPVVVEDEFWPVTGTDFSTLTLANMEDWAQRRYMLKDARIRVDTVALGLRSNSSLQAQVRAIDNSGSWGATPRTFVPDPTNRQMSYATYTWDTRLNDAGTGMPNVFGFTTSGTAPTRPGALVVLSGTGGSQPTTEATPAFDWKTNGPFAKATVTFTATPWPTLTSSAGVSLKTSDPRSYAEAAALYMVRSSDALDYLVSAAATGVRVKDYMGMPVTSDDTFMGVSLIRADGATDQAPALGTPLSTSDRLPTSHMSSFYTPAASGPIASGLPASGALPVQWAGGAAMVRPALFFVEFRPAACAAAVSKGTITASVRPTVANARIECSSHMDCIKPADGPHPAQARARNSSNGDASRFSTCYLFGNITTYNTGVLSTRCMECAPVATPGGDLECEEGQYCHADTGVCATTGTNAATWLCDPDSAALVGTCRQKRFLGSRCRTVATGQVTAPATSGQPAAGTAASNPSQIGAVFSSLKDEANGFAPGAGFCGEVAVLNATASGQIQAASPNDQFAINGTARAVLWTGSCVAGICYECDPASFANDNNFATKGKACVNGRYVQPLTVDFTARTLTLNSQASAGAVAAAFLLLLLLLSTCEMQNASNRHRELFGDGPMSTTEVVAAALYQWACCCKRPSARARRAPYTDVGHSGARRATYDGKGGSEVTNPLSGSAQDWAATPA